MVKFKQIKVPKAPRKDKYDELYKEWKDMYGGIYKMYKLNYRSSERENQFQPENGWCLVEKSTHGGNIYIEFIFPYAVGFYAPDPYLGYNYFPTVEEAVNEAYDFFTTDNKNKLQKYQKGINDKIIDEIIQSNEYYHIAEGANQDGSGKRIGKYLFCEVDTIKKDNLWATMTPDLYEYTYMYNGYYKVYIAKTQPIAYCIKKFSWNPDECERKDLLIKWSIIISSIFIIIEIILIISEIKRRKRLKEPIYDKLLRVCNPGNFIKPHDTNKFEIATELYKKLQNISKEDVEGIISIQKEVVVKLGVELIDKEEKKLLKDINPKKWANPYNEEKIKLANELFVKLNARDLTYSEFILIKKQAKALLI